MSRAGYSEPYPYSTDMWSEDSVVQLSVASSRQQPYPHRAAIMLGAGSMPDIFRFVEVDDVYVADRYPRVIRSVLGRVAMTAEHSDWNNYTAAVMATLPPGDHELYAVERDGTKNLRGDFAATRDTIARTVFYELSGDILETAPQLGERLMAEGTVVSFVNFTNIATYLRVPERDQQRTLREGVLDVVPMALDAVIVDSTPLLIPHVYTLGNYGVRQR